jgi:hypothetical protein
MDLPIAPFSTRPSGSRPSRKFKRGVRAVWLEFGFGVPAFERPGSSSGWMNSGLSEGGIVA